MITKVAEARHLVKLGGTDPKEAFPKIQALAASNSWQEREVAATALVEISKKQPEAVVREMLRWAPNPDTNIRRAASEGLRHVARHAPATVVPVLELLRDDSELYVRKSVGNILRNASNRHPEFVLELCRRWSKLADARTNWTIKDGLKKLLKTRPQDMDSFLHLLGH